MMDLSERKHKFTSSDGVSIVNFYVNWCFYSKIQKLMLNKFHQTIGKKVKIYYVNSDKNKTLAEELSIQSYPSIIIFSNGTMVSHLAGLQDNETLMNTVNKYIS